MNVAGRTSEVRTDMPLNIYFIFVTFAVLNPDEKESEVRARMSLNI